MKNYITIILVGIMLWIPVFVIYNEYKDYRQEEQAFRLNELKMRLKSVCQTADALGGKDWGYKSCLKELKVFEAKEVLN